MPKKKLVVALILLLIAGVGVWIWLGINLYDDAETIYEEVVEETLTIATTSLTVIGESVEGRSIHSYTFGTGDTNLLFVGGIHGGYEWNSSLLAYEMIDHLYANGELIPNNLTVHIIPALNPDGLFEATNQEGRFEATDIPNIDIHTTGIGRFNANNIDLNRNFDCRWAPESSWRGQTVSAGSAPFSEPEALAFRDYVLEINPVASVFWHSQANNVYGSECGNGVAADTLSLMQTYARAASYGEVPVFDAYTVTGAAEDWLASIGIPAVTVELETRNSIEWTRNLAGVEATLNLYSE